MIKAFKAFQIQVNAPHPRILIAQEDDIE